MGILVNAHKISKTFGLRPLFREIAFGIDEGDKIGLIGPNGAGKSTLLKILANLTLPDTGSITYSRGVRIAYLHQVPKFTENATILSSLLEGTTESHLEDWELDQRAFEIISKLELEKSGLSGEMAIAKLSGGQKKKVALGRELMKEPHLLLLDEPTNHLDIESIMWLENFLTNQRFASLTITHDRLFLQRVAKKIFELDQRNPTGLLSVNGDYSTYLDIKDASMTAQESREEKLKNTMRRENEWLKRGAKARSTKQTARIERADDLKNEIIEIEQLNRKRILSLNFETSEKNPKKLLEFKNISKSFGGRNLFSNLNLLLAPKTRLGIIGENGAGKSTLLKMILGNLQPDSGQIIKADNLKIVYFEQGRELLDPNLSVEKTLNPDSDHVILRGSKIHIRGYLARFLFRDEQIGMPVGKLSGGEQARLMMAKLMLQDANLLILDEPTNDLDLETLNVLEENLKSFEGAIILVTHDRYFLDQVSTQIMSFPPLALNLKERLLQFFIGIIQWEEWFLKEQALVNSSGPNTSEILKSNTPMEKKRKLSFKEQKEFDSIEATIAKTESALAQLADESTKPNIISNTAKLLEITGKMAKLEQEIARLYNRWSELTS